MEVIDVIEENNIINARPEQIIRDRLNLIEEFSDTIFMKRFRFPKQVVLDLLDEMLLTHTFDDPQGKGYSVSAINQLLLTLHFYSLSSFLRTNGDVYDVSKATSSQIIKRCTAASAS